MKVITFVQTERPLLSPSSGHHIHLNMLLLLVGGNSSHLSYETWIANTNSSTVSEELCVVLFI